MSFDFSRMAPFIHTERTTKYMYFCFLIALVPPVTFAVFYYGLRAIVLILFCSFLASLCHGFKDYSAPVHGVVLALMLPASCSLYTATIGVLASELLLKKMFGGPGSNVVYPAAFARALIELIAPSDLYISCEPGQEWFALKSLFIFGGDSKGIIESIDYSTAEIIAGRFSSYMGMGCCSLILIGMLFIWRTHIAKLVAPVCYLVSVYIFKLLVNFDGSFFEAGIFMMTSGVVFVAVYMLTDPTNTAQFGNAAIVEGVVCGLATSLLSIRITGIMLVLVPVLLMGLMDGSIRFYVGLLEKKRLEEEINV